MAKRTRGKTSNRRLRFKRKTLSTKRRVLWSASPNKTVLGGSYKKSIKRPTRIIKRPTQALKSKNIKLKTSVVSTTDTNKHTNICKQRQTRTEIMHAIKKAGQVGHKKPTWNKQSYIKC